MRIAHGSTQQPCWLATAVRVQISKSALFAVGSPHSWPGVLAALTWLVELLDYEERAEAAAGGCSWCMGASTPHMSLSPTAASVRHFGDCHTWGGRAGRRCWCLWLPAATRWPSLNASAGLSLCVCVATIPQAAPRPHGTIACGLNASSFLTHLPPTGAAPCVVIAWEGARLRMGECL